jgi:hypothetical protein
MASEADFDSFQQKFLRDLNRVADSDRNARRRGLQKLLEDLPWDKHSSDVIIASHLERFCKTLLFRQLLDVLGDPVEKCREISIAMYRKMISSFDCGSASMGDSMGRDSMNDLIRTLCKRVGESPFLEVTEELRLQIAQLLTLICSLPRYVSNVLTCSDTILNAIGRLQCDTFPAVKRECCETIIILCQSIPGGVQKSFKACLAKGILANAQHQHYKTRTVAIQVFAQ